MEFKLDQRGFVELRHGQQEGIDGFLCRPGRKNDEEIRVGIQRSSPRDLDPNKINSSGWATSTSQSTIARSRGSSLTSTAARAAVAKSQEEQTLSEACL